MWVTEQLILNMGPELTDVCTLALRAIPQVRAFCTWKSCISNTVHCILFYDTVCVYISPLQVKNKPCEGVKTSAFILGPVIMVVN
jgi:hypothetical protein